MMAELVEYPALADDSIDGTSPAHSTYDDAAALASEDRKAATELPIAQSSGLSVPPEVDIAIATAVRLPIRLSRGVDELPLGTCLRISGLPPGVTLSGGQANPGNGWIVPLWALEDLKIRLPPDGVSSDIDLVVALVDNQNAVIDQQTTRLRSKQAAHPTPALADHDAKGAANSLNAQSPSLYVLPEVDIATATAVHLSIRLSHSIDELPLGTSLRVSGLPPGVTLSGGRANPGNGWIVPLRALEDLKIYMLPEVVSGDFDLAVALVDNQNAVIDQQTTRLRIKAAAHLTSALADRDAASSVTPTPALTDQKHATAEAPSSPATDMDRSTNTEFRKFELTSVDFRAEGRGGASLVKQIGLPDNHRHTTGIAVAERDLTDYAMVDDLTKALKVDAAANNPDIQVYPTPGSGGLKSVRDVLTLPSTDFAIVSVLAMNKLQSTKAYGDIGERLALVGPLLTEELHVLAAQHVDAMRDLVGKTVSLGPKGSLAATLGHDILEAFDVRANEVNLDLDGALDGVRAGKIAAVFLISGKPVRLLAERTLPNGIHFLAVPYLRAFERDFVRTSLTHDDYPGMVTGADIGTIGIQSALWAYRWPEQSERVRLVKLFLDRLTKHLPELRSGAFHPKWKEVDFSDRVSGWSRFDLSKGGPAETSRPGR